MSTAADIEVSYDVGNDFFALWLDRERNYSCALWSGPDDELEAAQSRKLGHLSDLAGSGPDTAVLDIGCGWGANLRYQATHRRVRRMHGITLSPAQFQAARDRQIPGVTLQLCDYRDFKPTERFDAVFSIGMMEHVATPQQVRAGAHRRVYHDFFRRAHAWTRPGAAFALQVILRDRIPRDRADLIELKWVTDHIFPGGMTPRLEDVLIAIGPYWELTSLHTRRPHYERTCAEWRRRLRASEQVIRKRWGDRVFLDYDRYLSACMLAFAKEYQSLGQFGLRRRETTR